MDFDKTYTCPSCACAYRGVSLFHNTDMGTFYVCPYCGEVQEEKDVEQQLGNKEE